MKNCGYYPTRRIVTRTLLGLDALISGEIQGQKIYGVCLDGPTGAGKSFYAKTYAKYVEKLFKTEVNFISYTCNTTSGKADLYEEVNITAAIAGQTEKIIIPGQILEAIESVNQGKITILFIDEYDKSRPETDSFFNDFMQDGVINTTQRGKIKIKDEYAKYLQVIVAKNDFRNVSEPFSRRFKIERLDYMTPENLAKAIQRSLPESNASIKNAVILLYTAMYKTLEDNSEYLFSRLPACSECMQAVKEAEKLMNYGCDYSDIVVTAILANFVKDEGDIELFKAFLQNSQNDQLIEWYELIMQAVGKNNKNELERLKRALAESFYPEQLREVSKELDRVRAELEKEKELLDQHKEEFEKRSSSLQQKEEELKHREEQTEKLRANAYEDAKQGAEKYLQMQQQKLKSEYDKKNGELEAEKKKTQKLREGAFADAEKEAERRIKSETEKIREQFEEKKEELMEELKSAIDEKNAEIVAINEMINNRNYSEAERVAHEQTIKAMEEELTQTKILLEKVLGRKIQDSDFLQLNSKSDESFKTTDGTEFVSNSFNDFINGEIQENTFQSTDRSIIDYFQGNIFPIGYAVLETKDTPKQFVFKENNSNRLNNTLKENNGLEEINKDGIILYKGKNTTIACVRVIEKTANGKYRSVYKFFSSTIVIPINCFNRILGLIANLKKGICGVNLSTDQPISIEFDCLVASLQQQENGKDFKFEKNSEDERIYTLKYNNTSNTEFNKLALELYKKFKCSTKNMEPDELEKIQRIAFIKHCEYFNNVEMMREIQRITIGDIDNEKEK